MGGRKAAELFYDERKCNRHGVAPMRIQKTLFGEHTIQSLDGAQHCHRKKMFMSLLSPERQKKLIEIISGEWEITIDRWSQERKIVLYEEMKELLCRSACHWVGVRLQQDEVKKRTNALALLFKSQASLGLKHWGGRQSRKESEEWIAD